MLTSLPQMETAIETDVVPEIGKYHLVAELARGGMGIVHLAVAQGPGGFSKLLVLKELRPELAEDESYVAMFLDEARLAARLTHRNIVQTIEVGSEGPRHYMVMEFLDGRSLHRITRRFADRGGFPVGAHLRVIAEGLLGLQYAHDLRDFDGEPLGIVHRDVSPLNTLVTFDGQVKVVDFGIAKSIDSTLETKTGVLKGRVAYMAPEQAFGQTVDGRADVYAAGVMIWEAVTGQRLWNGKNDVEILARILREGPPPLRTVKPDVSRELEELCGRAMARDPANRHPSAAALLDDLESHLGRRADAMTMRDVGGLVSAVFAEERRRMSAVIEETLARVRGSSPRSGVIPTLEGQTRGTPSQRKLAISALGEPGDSALVSITPGQLLSCQPSTAASTPASDLQPVRTPPWHDRRARLVGMAAAGLAGLVALVIAGHGRAPSAPPPAVATVSEAPHPPAAVAPGAVAFTIRVTPSSAQVTIDGAPLASNPFHGRCARDGIVHRVSATADGYDAKVEDVPFTNDVAIDISLDRHPPPQVRWMPLPPPVRPAAAAKHADVVDPTPAPAPAPARTDVGPAGGHAPLRPIQTSNPYGSQ